MRYYYTYFRECNKFIKKGNNFHWKSKETQRITRRKGAKEIIFHHLWLCGDHKKSLAIVRMPSVFVSVTKSSSNAGDSVTERYEASRRRWCESVRATGDGSPNAANNIDDSRRVENSRSIDFLLHFHY